MKKCNKMACTIVCTKKMEFQANMYYAWCRECYQVKEAVPRECAAGVLPTIENFVCSDCLDCKDPPQSKPCPGCQTPTTKSGGCNHITCPCGIHWCFQCGEEFNSDEIYEHMEEEHGGLGFEYMID